MENIDARPQLEQARHFAQERRESIKLDEARSEGFSLDQPCATCWGDERPTTCGIQKGRTNNKQHPETYEAGQKRLRLSQEETKMSEDQYKLVTAHGWANQGREKKQEEQLASPPAV